MNWKKYQSQQKFLQMGELKIAYTSFGDSIKPTVLCLHGIPTWGYIYHDLAKRLGKDFHVLVPDLPGYGFSSKSDNFDRSIDKQAGYMLQFLNELEIDECYLVGHDIGGGVAQRLAVSHRDRFSGMCLMNTISYDSWPVEMMLQLGHPLLKKFPVRLMLGFLKQGLRMGFSENGSKEVREGILAPWNSEEGKISLIRNASSLNTNHTTEIAPLLRELRLPTLLLWGLDDKFQDVSFGHRLCQDIPSCDIIEISQASHWVMLDRPNEVYTQVKGFLSQETMNKNLILDEQHKHSLSYSD